MARGYKLGHSSIKDRKRREAGERQAERDKRTPEQQIELAKQRRGNSSKEIERLSKVKRSRA